MRFGTAAVVFLCVVFDGACGGGPSQKQTSRALQNLQSWTATARLAATAWRAGSTPRAYTFHTLELAQKQIDQENQKLRSAALAADLRAQVASHSNRVRKLLQVLDTAVKQSNGTPMTEELQQLAAEQKFFAALHEQNRESSK
jgi:hypothetical protein